MLQWPDDNTTHPPGLLGSSAKGAPTIAAAFFRHSPAAHTQLAARSKSVEIISRFDETMLRSPERESIRPSSPGVGCDARLAPGLAIRRGEE